MDTMVIVEELVEKQQRSETLDDTTTPRENFGYVRLEKDERIALPKKFAVRSKCNDRYLCFINKESFPLVPGYVQFNAKTMVTPFTQFEAVVSKSRPHFYHIKCSFNSKFLVRFSSETNFISATADEPEEDPSKWSCTLFQPLYDPDHNAFRFTHVQLNSNLYHFPLARSVPELGFSGCLFVGDPEGIAAWDYTYSLFSVIDWRSVRILPKHVAFKGSNGKYLKVVGRDLTFSGTDLNDKNVSFEILSGLREHIRIKSDETGNFMIFKNNLIRAMSRHEADDNPTILFYPVAVSKKYVTLRNMSNNLYCKRITGHDNTDHMSASVETITRDACLEVVELVGSREINHVDYHLQDAKVYNKKVLTMSIGEAINKTSETDTVTFKFSYEDKKKSTWTSTTSAKFGVTTKFKPGIPPIGNVDVEVSFEVGFTYVWGDSKKSKTLVGVDRTVTIPPMSRVKIKSIISQASVDLPFSYTQVDTLPNGDHVTHRYSDGIYNGVYNFDFQFLTENVPF